MKVTEVGVKLGCTKNLGNYNSLRLDASIAFEVEENDDVRAVFAEGWKWLEEEIARKLEEDEEAQN